MQPALHETLFPVGKVVRAAEGAGLENQWAVTPPQGFESLTFRFEPEPAHPLHPVPEGSGCNCFNAPGPSRVSHRVLRTGKRRHRALHRNTPGLQQIVSNGKQSCLNVLGARCVLHHYMGWSRTRRQSPIPPGRRWEIPLMVSTRLICSPQGNHPFTAVCLACRGRNVTGKSYCHFRGQFCRGSSRCGHHSRP